MNRPPKRPKTRTDREAASSGLRRGDIAKIGGVLVAAVILNLSIVHLSQSRARYHAIEQRLAGWRHAYQLPESDYRQIRELEHRFRKSYAITRPQYTEKDEIQHDQEIAALMDEEARQNFLRDHSQR